MENFPIKTKNTFIK